MADSKVSELPSDSVPLTENDYFYVIKSVNDSGKFISKKISFFSLVEECRKAIYTVEEDAISANTRISLLTPSVNKTSFILPSSLTRDVFEKIIINRSGSSVSIEYNDEQTVFVNNNSSVILYFVGDKWTVTALGGDLST